jgi:hypothetical protein
MKNNKLKGVKFSWKKSRNENIIYDRIIDDVRGQYCYDVDIYNYDDKKYQDLTIISDNGVIYKMYEIDLYPINMIRKDKIDKILNDG